MAKDTKADRKAPPAVKTTAKKSTAVATKPAKPKATPAPKAAAKPPAKPKATPAPKAAAKPKPTKPKPAKPKPTTPKAPPAPKATTSPAPLAKPEAAASPPPKVEAPVVLPPVDMPAGLGLARVTSALGGASLCYGEPIEIGERVIVPIARVRGAGGYGFGRGSSSDVETGDGGGAGGAVEASPAGFLDITPDSVRYEAIPDPLVTARAVSTVASALVAVVGAAAGLRRMSRRRRAPGLLPPR